MIAYGSRVSNGTPILASRCAETQRVVRNPGNG